MNPRFTIALLCACCLSSNAAAQEGKVATPLATVVLERGLNHKIVQTEAGGVQLKKWDVDLDSAENGVALPKAFHQKVHTNEYLLRLQELDRKSGTKEQTNPRSERAGGGVAERVEKGVIKGKLDV